MQERANAEWAIRYYGVGFEHLQAYQTIETARPGDWELVSPKLQLLAMPLNAL
jgi:hypothetical protein